MEHYRHMRWWDTEIDLLVHRQSSTGKEVVAIIIQCVHCIFWKILTGTQNQQEMRNNNIRKYMYFRPLRKFQQFVVGCFFYFSSYRFSCHKSHLKTAQHVPVFNSRLSLSKGSVLLLLLVFFSLKTQRPVTA
jgi:hypothetical protein